MQSGNTVSSAPPSGMRDLLPSEVTLRDWATGIIVETYEKFGFTRIETPALIDINLLRRGEGGENLQLIFEVLKRGEKLERELASGKVNKNELADLGLRFDLTVPLVRFYANNIAQLPNPFKAIQIGSVWRAESPQVGRYRQFTQCDIDMIGVKSELAEIELLQATSEALLQIGFKDFKIRINDRRILSDLVGACGFNVENADKIFIAIDKLDKIGLAGVTKELEGDNQPASAIQKLCGFLDRLAKCDGDFATVRGELPPGHDELYYPLAKVMDAVMEQSGGHYTIQFDPTLVRGMGYYTGQIFEIVVPGYSSSIAGGGRYDKMVGKFSGRDVPACGFSIGFERIINILTEKGFKPPVEIKKLAIIVDPDRDDLTRAASYASSQRTAGYIVSLQPKKKEMGKQIDAFAAQGFSHFCIFKTDSEPEIKTLSS